MSELERKLPRPSAPRAIEITGLRCRALVHRLSDADEVQRLRLDERQSALEDFLAAVRVELHDRALVAAPSDEIGAAAHWSGAFGAHPGSRSKSVGSKYRPAAVLSDGGRASSFSSNRVGCGGAECRCSRRFWRMSFQAYRLPSISMKRMAAPHSDGGETRHGNDWPFLRLALLSDGRCRTPSTRGEDRHDTYSASKEHYCHVQWYQKKYPAQLVAGAGRRGLRVSG
jgi:hypothetical protein